MKVEHGWIRERDNFRKGLVPGYGTIESRVFYRELEPLDIVEHELSMREIRKAD